MRLRLVLILMASCLLLSCTSKKEKALEHFSAGKGLFYQHEFDAAIAEFSKALELDPALDQAWFFRGNAKSNLRDMDGALADFDGCINVSPGFAEAYSSRAQIKFIQGDKDGACTDWKKAQELGMANLSDRLRGCK